MIKKYLLVGLVLGLLYLQALFFCVNDMISIVLVLISTVIIYRVVFILQEGNKRALRVNTKEGGFLHAFLSREKSLFVRILSFFVSLSFATILTVILKGIVLNHGVITFFIITFFISMAIFSFVNKGSIEQNNNQEGLITENLAPDISKHANNLLFILLIAVILNTSLSLLFSAHDTFVFLNNDVNFSNFDVVATERAIEKTLTNAYSRPLMNLYIILDTFKMAVANQFIEMFIDNVDKEKYFYLFFTVVFFLNMVKLFAFSISFVLLQKGLEGIAETCTLKMEKYKIIDTCKNLLSKFRSKKNKEVQND